MSFGCARVFRERQRNLPLPQQEAVDGLGTAVVVVVGDGDVGGPAGVLVGVAHGHGQARCAQHGQVVVRVAHGDGLFGGNSQLRRECQKAGALGHARVGDLDAVLLAVDDVDVLAGKGGNCRVAVLGAGEVEVELRCGAPGRA